MDPLLDPMLKDLALAMPANAAEHGRRMGLVHEAVLSVAPHLTSGRVADVQPKDLRTLFVALDLFVFGARYHAAFELSLPVVFVWYLNDSEDGPDSRLEYVAPPDPHQSVDEPILIEFHVAPARVVSPERAQESGVPKSGVPESGALLDGLAQAMLRLMLQGVALTVAEGKGRGLALAEGLAKRLRLEA